VKLVDHQADAGETRPTRHRLTASRCNLDAGRPPPVGGRRRPDEDYNVRTTKMKWLTAVLFGSVRASVVSAANLILFSADAGNHSTVGGSVRQRGATPACRRTVQNSRRPTTKLRNQNSVL